MIFRNYDESMPKIVDFKAKWEVGSFEYQNTIRHFTGDTMNPVLKQRIMDTALRCWNVFGLRGYARVDMRIDHNDNPFVIEVNANPCISPDSGVVAAIAAAGLPFTAVLSRIINDIYV
jgi:D-alanine-D-alanine ligase